MRALILILSVFFAHVACANETASATIAVSVYLEPDEGTDTSLRVCPTSYEGPDAACQQSPAEYSIQEADGQMRVTVKPVVRVTVEPI